MDIARLQAKRDVEGISSRLSCLDENYGACLRGLCSIQLYFIRVARGRSRAVEWRHLAPSLVGFGLRNDVLLDLVRFSSFRVTFERGRPEEALHERASRLPFSQVLRRVWFSCRSSYSAGQVGEPPLEWILGASRREK